MPAKCARRHISNTPVGSQHVARAAFNPDPAHRICNRIGGSADDNKKEKVADPGLRGRSYPELRPGEL